MKLGQQVRFKKCLIKGHDGASFNYLTPKQEKELENTCQLKIRKLVEKEFGQHKTGIVVGKRRVGIETTLEEAQNHEGDFLDRFSWYDTTYDTVFLVACNLKGFYKVREEDLEVIS
ncbi:hypothetical protein P9D39_03530 [Heyndrickxia oleronia]|uniref:Uncharacterized protein n=1 Tax=Heyndrickxia oleronia TaxID=38875 RepID=A0A8E2I8P7_9BACI|nr:hypothetical protein [Heyndrickxia oleronia]MEC1373382.1 hypothetical protein [Heyndrickxia oleronia]OOP68826.1 hypothetical protein BWZ43_08365 [Heyndrickxia oleronia]QQZ04321.1 hypothetical protein I5818_22010 [Heyndrickxia oleronia]